MITHGNEIKLFSGNSNRPLAEAIAKKLNPELGEIEVAAFSAGILGIFRFHLLLTTLLPTTSRQY